MNRQRPARFWFLATFLAGLLVMLAGSVTGAADVTRLQTESVVGDPIEPDGQIGGITNGLAARGDFVYLGVGPRLVVLNLSGLEAFDNYDDYRVGQTPPLPDIVRDVVVDGSYAYVAAGTGGLRVIDISDPTAPREVAALAVGENARAIDHEGTTVYLGDNGPSGLHVIDVSDPTAPRELGAAEWRAGIWEISAVGDYAYVADGYDLFIFDVADPTAPRQVGSVGTNCSALDVALAGDYAYVADHDNCGLLIADISDPTIQTHVSYAFPEEAFYLNPTLRSSDQHESVRVEVAGQYAYVVHKVVIYADNGETYTRSQLTIFDITNPAAPDPVARFNLNENRPYSQVTDLVIDGNAAYLSTVDGWLYVVDLSDLRLSNPVDHYPVLGPVVGVVADGGGVTAATTQALHDGFENGLDRSYFLLRQTMEERIVSWLGEDGGGYMTTEADVIAFDLHGLNELFGPMPTELGRNSPSSRPFYTALDGDRLWLFYYRDGEIVIADATSPGRFSGGGAVPTPEALSYNPSRVVVGNGIAYLFYFESPPWMIDLRGDTPQPIGFLGDEAVDDVVAIGDIAYAATGDGLRRYDLTDPASPRLLDPLAGVAAPLALGNDGPYLFVADAGERLNVFDTTTGEPALVAVLRGPNEFVGVSVDGDKVYVAGGESGLWAYTLPGLNKPEAEPSGLVFNNFPLSEAILVYVDENDDLALENVDTGVVARLTTSGDVNNYVLAPTRDRILYVDQSGRAHAMALDFHADGLLSVQTLPVSFLPGATEFRWASDGQHLAYRNADFTWWITGLSGSDASFPLSDSIYYLGGWSPDGQWVFYCTAEYVFEIVNVSGQVTPVDQDISCDRVEGGEWARWSPAAPLLAYARGRIGREPDGLRPVIFNAATGESIELPVDHYIMGWSPDGRYLALAKDWSAGGQQVVESITIVNDQGVVIEQLPGYSRATWGQVGWVRATEEEVIFGRYELGDAPGESTSHINALFGISNDGTTRWWGLVGDASFVVLCTDGDGRDTDVYHSLHPTFPDESNSTEFSSPQSGILVLVSPDGSTALLDAYEGGETWRRILLRCEGGEPLIETPADISNRYLFNYSADSRRILWFESTDGQLAPRVYSIGDSAQLLPTSENLRRSAAWLITPTAKPPVIEVAEVNAIAGHVTDHTGAPLPGAEVRAGELTTTTDSDGAYRFDDLEDGGYTVAVALAGYVFTAPMQVTVPPAQLAVNFQAEPPARYTLTGRVTDCAGQPVPGVAISADGAGNPTTTDANGHYTLSDLARQTYSVRAEAEGRAFLPARRTVDLARYAPGETLTVDFIATTPDADEFCIPHLEIIQVVQDEYNSAPIIAGKPAVLRAYLHCPNCDPDETVTGTLQAFRAGDGAAIPARGEPFAVSMNQPSDGVTWATHRGDLGRSLNFMLPPEWLEGEVRFRVSANSAAAELDVTFEPGKPLRIYYVPYTYMLPSDPLVLVPAPTPLPTVNGGIVNDGREGLLAMLPIARGDLIYEADTSVRQAIPFPFDTHMNAERYLDALNNYWLRQQQVNGWRDGHAPDRLIGWVANADAHSTCCAGIADARFLDNRGAVAAISMDNTFKERLADLLGRLHFQLETFTLVHELGHLLDNQGLRHTSNEIGQGQCLDINPQGTAPDFPVFAPLASIGDMGIYINGGSYTLLHPSRTFDIMSYCFPNWMSLHNYKRFHHGFMPLDADTGVAAVAAPTAPAAQLLISGRIISATQTAEIDPIFAIEAVAPPTTDVPGDYCVELRDVADAPLDRRCFSPSFREGITGHATETAGFQLAVPWIDGATAVVATRGGQELGRVAASADLPTINGQVNWQVSEDGSTLTLTWGAVDGDGDDLVYNVGLSGARGYIPLAFGIREQQLTVDARQLPGGEPLNLVVEVSDGFHSSRSESPKPLDLPAKPPVVAIAPVEDALIAGQPFWLFGLARDVEDGVLSDEALVWSVNGEELGRGAQLFATLPPGEHTLTLTATDSDGEQTSAETTLLLEGVPEETTEETNWLGWIVLGSGVVLLGGLLFLMWARRRSIS